jgi:O-antigen/teichoic acid export membrane protein
LNNSFKKKIIDGSFWSVLLSSSTILIQLASVLILSRIFTPLQFGELAIAIMILEFCKAFTFQFVVKSIVLEADVTPSFFGTANVVTILQTLLTIGVLYIFKDVLMGFFGKSGMSLKTLYFVFLALILTGIYRPLKAYLEKQIRFKEIQQAEIVIIVVSVSVQIVLSILYRNLLALFSGIILAEILRVFYFNYKVKFRVGFDTKHVKRIYQNASEILIGNLANKFAVQGDNLVISRYLGMASLGIYSRAYKLMKLPTNVLGNVFNHLAFPSFVLLDDQKLRKAYVNIIYLLSFCLFPLVAIIFIFYSELVDIILGSGWEQVKIPFLILGAGIYLRLAYKIPATVLKSKEMFRKLMWTQLLYAIMVVLFAFLLRSYGVTGVALGTIIALFLNNVILVTIANKKMDLPLKEYLKLFGIPILNFALSFIVLMVLKFRLSSIIDNRFLVLAISLGAYLSLVGIIIVKFKSQWIGERGMWWIDLVKNRNKVNEEGN